MVAALQIVVLALYSTYWFYYSSDKYPWLNIFYPFALISIMFPVNYLANTIINLLYPATYALNNSKFYMCHPIYYLEGEPYPAISIVIPVYLEDFWKTLIPTIASALQTRDNYNGKCNIIVLDDGYQFQPPTIQELKSNFYQLHGISMIARPQTPRLGKFKKASNLNNHLNLIRNSVELNGSVAFGDYQMGKYFILIDSDSRIPHDDINDIVSTIDCIPEVGYIQFHTKPLGNSYVNFFSRQIAQFTKNLYDLVFVVVTLGGEPSPLVGHNAIIRTTTLYESQTNDRSTFWSENKVSEDFDFSFRSMIRGYYGVYATFATFQEGISFDLSAELLKMSKFSYGAVEMLCSKTYYRYILSGNVPWPAKVNITSYLFSYISLALAPIISMIILILSCYIKDLYSITVDPVMLMVTSFVLFSVLGPISTWICLRRFGYHETTLISQLIMGLFMFAFYSGSMFWFLMGIVGNRTWGATNKEQGKVNVMRTYRHHYFFTGLYSLATILILSMICANWYGAIPSLVIIIMHVIIPFLWRGSTEKLCYLTIPL